MEKERKERKKSLETFQEIAAAAVIILPTSLLPSFSFLIL
jgi:hypothetical protein